VQKVGKQKKGGARQGGAMLIWVGCRSDLGIEGTHMPRRCTHWACEQLRPWNTAQLHMHAMGMLVNQLDCAL
jgi:hypothetical protein